MINSFLAFGLAQMSIVEAQQEEWKERIKQKFKETKNFPRKKKKQARKKLNLEWSIANYNVFNW